MSRSTFPGPTLGSWLESPTRMRWVPTLTAFNRAFIRRMSTMLISSIMTQSASSGICSFRSKRRPLQSPFFSFSSSGAPEISSRR